ncbi:hypothetical protein RJT34_18628 [Clitoria ternatea]|uniref:DC1 domain-containing protein n=1 Tax=Clitoria ternatea TaxID=43366 RepID=A0AAN9JBY0_CLITE
MRLLLMVQPCKLLLVELELADVERQRNLPFATTDPQLQNSHNIIFVSSSSITTKMDCPKHSQPLQHKSPGAPFRCNGCHELGFGVSYYCENSRCSYKLHDVCTDPVSVATHPFFPGSVFTFYNKAPGYRPRYCDACGKDVLGFVYHCSKTGYDLHPCCLQLKHRISDEEGSVALTLCNTTKKKCVKCKHRNVVDRVKGWSYVSSEGNCYHVSCVKELVLENWNRGYFSHETNSRDQESQIVVRSMGNMVQSGGRSMRSGTMRKYIKMAVVVFKLIFSAIFGNPVSAIAALVEAMVDN